MLRHLGHNIAPMSNVVRPCASGVVPCLAAFGFFLFLLLLVLLLPWLCTHRWHCGHWGDLHPQGIKIDWLTQILLYHNGNGELYFQDCVRDMRVEAVHKVDPSHAHNFNAADWFDGGPAMFCMSTYTLTSNCVVTLHTEQHFMLPFWKACVAPNPLHYQLPSHRYAGKCNAAQCSAMSCNGIGRTCDSTVGTDFAWSLKGIS